MKKLVSQCLGWRRIKGTPCRSSTRTCRSQAEAREGRDTRGRRRRFHADVAAAGSALAASRLSRAHPSADDPSGSQHRDAATAVWREGEGAAPTKQHGQEKGDARGAGVDGPDHRGDLGERVIREARGPQPARVQNRPDAPERGGVPPARPQPGDPADTAARLVRGLGRRPHGAAAAARDVHAKKV